MLNGKVMIIHLIAGLIKKIGVILLNAIVKKSVHFFLSHLEVLKET